MTVSVDGKTFEVSAGSHVYSEERDLFVDWSELSVQQVEQFLSVESSVRGLVEDCF